MFARREKVIAATLIGKISRKEATCSARRPAILYPSGFIRQEIKACDVQSPFNVLHDERIRMNSLLI